jgi:hypothetical protein
MATDFEKNHLGTILRKLPPSVPYHVTGKSSQLMMRKSREGYCFFYRHHTDTLNFKAPSPEEAAYRLLIELKKKGLLGEKS